ncbi:FAT4 [Branchiostoma lanceolatum]|uniref:FAT4 protein n=1 Tax=Branchiostoma lanceolatum TaxID=7740 RepID=A0A8J9ZZ97_BRALA|nr:FAT4 [Branchiostoma lanceolatum]
MFKDLTQEHNNICIYFLSTLAVTFTYSSASYTVGEDASAGDYVITSGDVTVTWTTSGGTTPFEIISPVGSPFQVDSTGAVTVASSSSLDYETTSMYAVTVRANDNTGVTDQATVTIMVTDAAEPPSFSNLPASRAVPEDVSVGTAVHTLSAADPDEPAQTLTYTIVSQTPSDKFQLSGGVVQVGAALDYESEQTYTLTLSVEDDTSGTPLSAESTLTVNVNDVIDEMPTFSASTYSGSVDENQAFGTTVTWDVAVSVTDGDDGDTISYSLSGTNNDHFAVDSTTGAVTTAMVLERDGADGVSAYTLVLTATDTADNTGTATLSVTVNDVNDNSATCDPDVYYSTVEENTAAAAPVALLSCTDPDDGVNSEIAFSIVSGDDTAEKFDIDASTGQITTSSTAVDYDTDVMDTAGFRYVLYVSVTDQAADVSDRLTSTATVVVAVTSTNDNAPTFTSFASSVVVNEDAPVGTTILSELSATDADKGADGTVSFSMIAATDDGNGIFHVDSSTGAVSIMGSLDFETVSSYELTLKAEDGGDPSLSATATLTVNVTDVNDNPPTFDRGIYTVAVEEGAAGGTSVATLVVSDADSSSSVSYEFVYGNDADKFKFGTTNTNDVEVKTTIDLDSATPDEGEYKLVVRVTDGGTPALSGTTTVYVTVTPTNQHDPTFTGSGTTAVSIDENDPVGTTVATVTATDDDFGTQGEVSYSIIDVSPTSLSGHFHVDSASGEVLLTSQVDYDTMGVIKMVTLTVRAADGGSGSDQRSANATVEVTVNDVNDNQPVCTPSLYSGTLTEDATDGTVIASLNCSDVDTSTTLSYSITAGNSGPSFEVSSTGVVTLIAGHTVDYESTTTSYSLVVQVSDGAHSVETAVAVDVQPINEHTPAFSEASYSVSVAENATVGASVVLVVATDADNGTDGALTYAIASGNGDGKFAVDAATGEVQVAAILDRETITSYILVLTAQDGGASPGPKTGTTTLSVTVTDVNDHEPVCSPSFHAVSISEGTAVGSTVTTVTCTDYDDGDNAVVAYEITSGNSNDSFDVNTASGDVTLKNSLDLEDVRTFTLIVEASDSGSQTQLTGTATVHVTLTNVNEFVPNFTEASYSFSVSENVTVGTSVGQISATDGDVREEGDVTFSIVSGNDGTVFGIDSFTGVISTATVLDRETTSSHTLEVEARDGGDFLGTYQTSTATVDITVDDVNDNTPTFDPAAIYIAVPESTTTGASIAQLSCSDSDVGENQELTYVISAGNDVGLFSLSSEGLISLAYGLDYETSATHVLTVVATDGGTSPQLSGTATVYVQVTSVNEHDPVFDPASPANASVDEDSAVGITVATVSATDDDAGTDGELTYTITETSPAGFAGHFAIGSSSGVINMASPIDYDTMGSDKVVTLTVQAADGASGADQRTANTTVDVTVNDVNDNRPTCVERLVSVVMDEDATNGTVVASMNCSDVDTSTLLSYNVTSGDAVSFQVSSSGDVFLASGNTVDYEGITTTYILTIDVSDGEHSTDVTVSVDVRPVNEHDPVFTSESYNVSVQENVTVGTVLLQVAASDADSGMDGEVTLSIEAGNEDKTFAVDATTGALQTVAPLDRETTPSYTLTIVAQDGGVSPTRSASTTVFVTASDVNDVIPVCSPSFYAVSVSEGADVNSSVAMVTCSDDDVGENAELDFSITTGNSNETFAINKTSGRIITANSLDLEVTNFYSLEVQVSDSGAQSLTGTATVYVTVTNVNDFAPTFSESSYSFNVSECESVGTEVGQVVASDEDTDEEGDVTYSIASGNDGLAFGIDPVSGVISIAKDLDREAVASYSLEVLAIDGGDSFGTYRNAITRVNITIIDENDNLPAFDSAVTYTSVLESTPEGTSLLQLNCTDVDVDANGEVSYVISTGNDEGVFNISSDGMIFLDKEADFETTTAYSLTVVATDGGAPQLSSTATVHVQVTAVNEHDPQFSPSTLSNFSINEDAAVGTTIAVVSATDDDQGSHGEVSYTITGTNPGLLSGHFSIDSQSGEIQLVSQLDYDTMGDSKVVTLTVQAVDGGSGADQRSASTTVNVTVSDVNDNTPECAQNLLVAQADENVENGTTVATLNCSDVDSGANLSYSIVSGNFGPSFDVTTSGAVIVLAGRTLDYESTNKTYYLTVEVNDGGHTVDVAVDVAIMPVNEDTPLFSADSYNVSVAENATLGYTLLQETATDADEGVDGLISYSIASGNEAGKFAMDGTAGALRTVGDLDRENTAGYVLVLLATDGGQNPGLLTGSTMVYVTVTDVNDNTAVCSPALLALSASEGAAVGSTVGSVTCTDQDDGINAVLSHTIIAGNTNSSFAVNSSTGDITVASALDLEVTPTYVLELMVTDEGDPVLTGSVTVHVQLTDDNEFAPAFTGAFFSFNISEDAAIGTTLGHISATDEDRYEESISYTIISGDDGNVFRLDTHTGTLSLKDNVDREITDVFSLVVMATDSEDSSGVQHNVTALVNITVLDINDNPPFFDPHVYYVSLLESASIGAAVAQLACTDEDDGTNADMTYLISTGNDASKFNVTYDGGEIILQDSLDYETSTEYVLTATASDGGTPSLTGTATVYVQVVAVNEHTPEIIVPTGGYDVVISEDVPIGASVISVTAVDSDSGSDGTVVYSIEDGNFEQKFVIDELTGEIAVTLPLDRESTDSYSLTVKAMDSPSNSSHALSNFTTVNITIEDVNDNHPVFTPSVYTTSVLEGASVGSQLIQLTATDADLGNNSVLDYAITAGDTNGTFNLIGDILVLASGLDHSVRSYYSITVTATDRGVPPLSSTANVVVNVLAENNYSPVFDNGTNTVWVSEDAAVGTTIYNVSATDADVGDGGELTYVVTSEEDQYGITFVVDSATGVVTLGSYLDRESIDEYVLNITVYDGEVGDSGTLKDAIVVTVIVTDVNDNKPTFTQPVYTVYIDENVPVGSNITTVEATDPDLNGNGEVTYSIVSGDGMAYFDINSTTGLISTSTDVDRETLALNNLVIQATDGGSLAKSSLCRVKIYLNDLNDNTPTFIPLEYVVSLLENAAVGTLVTPVQALDPDESTNALLTFAIFEGDDNNQFTIDSSTGTIGTAGTLDRESAESYTLTITATDSGTPTNLTGSGTVLVTVLDVNDNTPVLTQASYTASVSEGVSVGTSVVQVVASDEDVDENAEIAYSITSASQAGHFGIDAATGVVRTLQALDRETIDLYTLTVQATDNGNPSLANDTTVTITVDDENDNTPAFASNLYSFTLEENVAGGTSVGDVSASDDDIDSNADLSFSIITDDLQHFVVNSNTGRISTSSTANIDRETISQYSITCRVEDSGTPSLFSDVTVQITVSDVNDNAPIFNNNDTLTASLAENAEQGNTVIKVSATDLDEGTNADVIYTISSDPVKNGAKATQYFRISETTGVVTFRESVDRETEPFIAFVVIATDAGLPSLSSETDVNITIADVNDNKPVLTQTFYSIELSTDYDSSKAIVTLTATDADIGTNAEITFSLTESSTNFRVDPTSGVITRLTLSADTRYVIYVSASDAGIPPLTSSPVATVRIDTFDPVATLVSMELTMTVDEFLARQDEFLQTLQTAIQPSCTSTCTVGLSHYAEREVTISSRRRRELLQMTTSNTTTNYVTVYVYVETSNATTDFITGLGEDKTFLPASRALEMFQADDGALLSDSSLADFGITSVAEYPQEETTVLWIQTVQGIVVVSVGAGLLVILFAVIACCCTFRGRKKRKLPINKKSRAREGWEGERPSSSKKKGGHSQVLPIHAGLPRAPRRPADIGPTRPAYAETPRKHTPSEKTYGRSVNQHHQEDHDWFEQTEGPKPYTAPRHESDRRELAHPPPYGAVTQPAVSQYSTGEPREPRLVEPLMPKQHELQYETKNQPLPARSSLMRVTPNRHFDGRTVDPKTGRMYEYNTTTGERRWLSKEEQRDIEKQALHPPGYVP